MEKIFDDLLATEKGKETIFNIIVLATAYRNSVLKPSNPFVKFLGNKTQASERVRKLLFQNINVFEEFVNNLYTFDEAASQVTEDLTFPSK